MDNLYIQERFFNKTKGCHYGSDGVQETFTSDKEVLFKSLQKEHGRCVSKVCVDTPKKVKVIGWVFQKKRKYPDCDREYLCEVWVTIHSQPPTIKRVYHYA